MRNFFLHDNRALLVEGARQTGKTFTVRKVGRECFKHFVEINFYDHPEALDLFQGAQNAKDILLRISAFVKQDLVAGSTLIFFDEVQECKEIVTAVKFLVDEGSYRYVLSGSLLGIELKDIRSVPVGYLSIMKMYPLDIEEFATAIGIGKQVVDLQRDIVQLYRRDISKYDPDRKLQIEEIYDLIPSELNAKNKRFILKNLNEKGRFSRYEDSFVWLKDAGVAIATYNVEEPRVPLLLSKQRNLFKLFLNDVGLLASLYAGDIQQQLLRDEIAINNGSIFENLVAQEFYAHGLAGYGQQLYYFNSKKQGELDFIIEKGGSVIPIEVKSGKDYHRHNALTGVMSNPEYSITEAFTLCQGNVETSGPVTYLPIYMTMFIGNDVTTKDIKFEFDLDGLR